MWVRTYDGDEWVNLTQAKRICLRPIGGGEYEVSAEFVGGPDPILYRGSKDAAKTWMDKLAWDTNA